MNKIWIWVVVVVIIVAGAYLLFVRQPIQSPTVQTASCLTQDEVASNETSTTGNYVVVRNNQTKTEISRFALPTSTILVSSIGQCNVYVTEATNYSSAQINAGVVYNLPIGGSVDRWQYSYDGKSEKNLTVLTNVSPATGPALLKVDPSSQYISFVAPAQDDTEIQIYNLNTGTQLFSANLSRFPSKYGTPAEWLTLWKGNPDSVAWRQVNGDEVLLIALEDAQGDNGNVLIDTKDWSVKAQ